MGWPFAVLRLGEGGGGLDLDYPIIAGRPRIRFAWEEVEKVGKIKWLPWRSGVRFKLVREVVPGNPRKSFDFYPLGIGGTVTRILDLVEARGVKVEREGRFLFGP